MTMTCRCGQRTTDDPVRCPFDNGNGHGGHVFAEHDYPARGNPWADFLYYRMRVLSYLRADGQSVQRMSHAVNTDETQVRLLLETWDESYGKRAR